MSLLCSIGAPPSARAGTPCKLSVPFAISVERRGLTDTGASGLVVMAAPADASVRVGDLIRQANGTHVATCADLERAAAEALAKGLALLLGVERSGAFTAAAVLAQPNVGNAEAAAVRTTAPRPEDVAASAPSDGGEAREAASRVAPAAPEVEAPGSIVGPPRPAPALSPEPRQVTSLPAAADAPAPLRHSAASAATALTAINDTARLSVPLVLYERRLRDAETVIAALPFGEDVADGLVRAAVDEVLDYHRTARDVRRVKIELLSHRGIDQRGAAANALPYFSDSQIPAWVAAYPFLHASLIEPPRETRMPLPGEVAGRWDPDRALELLWSRARQATDRLTRWARE